MQKQLAQNKKQRNHNSGIKKSFKKIQKHNGIDI